MAAGKVPNPLGVARFGDVERDLDELHRSVQLLISEVAALPGFAIFPASVSIPRGAAVNLFNGALRLADASLSRSAQGICIRAASVGQPAGILLGMGYASGLSGLPLNSNLWLGNAGAFVSAKPSSGFIQGLGYTLSATELWVSIGSP